MSVHILFCIVVDLFCSNQRKSHSGETLKQVAVRLSGGGRSWVVAGRLEWREWAYL